MGSYAFRHYDQVLLYPTTAIPTVLQGIGPVWMIQFEYAPILYGQKKNPAIAAVVTVDNRPVKLSRDLAYALLKLHFGAVDPDIYYSDDLPYTGIGRYVRVTFQISRQAQKVIDNALLYGRFPMING